MTAPGEFRFRLNPPAREIPRCSTLLNGIARRYSVEDYQTTLSLKSVVRGAALYVTPQARHLVTEECFLILNSGQEYSLNFQGPGTTETICPFFQPGFLEHVAYCASVPLKSQLDEIETPHAALGFYEHLYPKTGRVDAILKRLRRGLKSAVDCGAWLEDRFYELAAALIGLRSETRDSIDEFPALRPATREELYRRLHQARDYLSACYAQPVTVAMAAKAAHLSVYHFHRMFKLAFGKTPMQFLQGRRLAAARSLLLTTDQPITLISLAVGFESLSSFSWLFRRRFRLSPRKFRDRHNGRN